MNTGSNKQRFIVVFVLVLGLLYWNQNHKGDSMPGLNIQNSIFENSYLTSSDGDRIYSYCFGLGGGIERGHPCVYIVNYYRDFSDQPENDCYVIAYLPEANYPKTYEEIPEERRYFPFSSTPFEVQVCGKFQLWDGSERGDGQNVDVWEFETDAYPSEVISSDLKSRGYRW
jgi:hypothetical protein